MVRLGSMSLELTEFLLGPLKDLEVLAFDKLQSNIGNKKKDRQRNILSNVYQGNEKQIQFPEEFLYL